VEKGTIATAFEARPFGVELQLCQRYYVKVLQNASGSTPFIGTFNWYSTTEGGGYINIPLHLLRTKQNVQCTLTEGTMAFNQTITQNVSTFNNSTFYVWSGNGQDTTFTNIYFVDISDSVITFTFTGGSPARADGKLGLIRIVNNKFVAISSEL